MILNLDLENCNEVDAETIKTALADPEVRAYCLVMGALLPLTPRARERIIMLVAEAITEEMEREEDLESEEEESQ